MTSRQRTTLTVYEKLQVADHFQNFYPQSLPNLKEVVVWIAVQNDDNMVDALV